MNNFCNFEFSIHMLQSDGTVHHKKIGKSFNDMNEAFSEMGKLQILSDDTFEEKVNYAIVAKLKK